MDLIIELHIILMIWYAYLSYNIIGICFIKSNKNIQIWLEIIFDCSVLYMNTVLQMFIISTAHIMFLY